ncbi:MAG TPA: disulfide bond formation protein B [Xanthobacteraceae bacterium]|nr:disulfide bond formation protein B [Xanthobacteraceae bacterium]
MHDTLAARPAWNGSFRDGPAAAALTVFVIALATLLGAWYFQYVLGYPPCPLCLEQRIPYYIVIPLSLVVAIAARWRAPRALVAAGFLILLAATLCGAALGTYHAGVEWGFWPGPTDCSGPVIDFSSGGSMLSQLQNPTMHIVRCDKAAWRFLGISLAGYNVLISLAMAAVAGYALLGRKAKPDTH